MNLYGNILLLSALLCLATAGSAEDDDDSIGWIGGPGTDEGVGMANPAATYCTNQGYQYSDGRCVFPDGSSCDAWDFYRGDCSDDPAPCSYTPPPRPPTDWSGPELPRDTLASASLGPAAARALFKAWWAALL